MKAQDINDESILEIVARRKFIDLGQDLWTIQKALQPDYPEKVVLAKIRQMVNKGRLRGCTCGCRGDFLPPLATPVSEFTIPDNTEVDESWTPTHQLGDAGSRDSDNR